jgi:hypothetical protein
MTDLYPMEDMEHLKRSSGEGLVFSVANRETTGVLYLTSCNGYSTALCGDRD